MAVLNSWLPDGPTIPIFELFRTHDACFLLVFSRRLSVTPFSQCSCHRIVMEFLGVITIDIDVRPKKGKDQKVNVTEVKSNFAPVSAFPDCNSSLNPHMAKKWCTELAVAQERNPNVLRGHPSKAKRDKNDTDWAFPDCNSSLNSLMAMKWWYTKLEGEPYCFSSSSVKFQGHRGKKVPLWPKLGDSGL